MYAARLENGTWGRWRASGWHHRIPWPWMGHSASRGMSCGSPQSGRAIPVQ
jgi:hypothetical protein